MSGHTPGPWHYSMGGRVRSEAGKLLASAWHPETMPDANDERQLGESLLDARDRLAPELARIEAEMEANAILSAAAPELLLALEDMLNGWKYIRSTYGDLYGVGWDRAQGKAEAALAKATGAKP